MEELVNRLLNLYAKQRFLAEAGGANLEQEAASADADRSPKFNGQAAADRTKAKVRAVVEEEEKEYDLARHSPCPVDAADTFRTKIIEQHAGTDMELVAQQERCSVYFVRQVRKEAGVSERNGKPRGSGKASSGKS